MKDTKKLFASESDNISLGFPEKMPAKVIWLLKRINCSSYWLLLAFEHFQDSRGLEFTVVLLDSEGIDATTSAGYDDNQIFTLTVLLASVLIYNSQGVPTRRDLEGLEYP